MSDMTFTEWVKQFPDTPSSDLAIRCVNEEPTMAAEVLIERIENVRRGQVRAIEQETFADVLRSVAVRRAEGTIVVPGAPRTAAQINMGVLLQERFALGGGVFVTWGQATIEQHERRIAMLKVMVGGLQETIERHEATIQQLREIGARCLDEVVVA